ncbi:hypothetical protein VNO80_01194 [Phaseolus coccineus]|uniref:Xylanase inhibitor C-terminal domain-containing protein n=1 Tax=Phaseolus coccineus TaxID=3886 RepID=A0AAN9P5X8_PHACN
MSISIILTILTPCLAFNRARSAADNRFHFSFHTHDTIVQCPSTISHPRHPPSSPSAAPSPIFLPATQPPPLRHPPLLRRLRPLPLPPPPPPTFSIYPVLTVLKGLATELSKALRPFQSTTTVNKKVQCLGFVDGGLELEGLARTSIVISGYQMEDNRLEFDLASSKLGFSSSLLLHNATCSHFRVLCREFYGDGAGTTEGEAWSEDSGDDRD